MKRFLVAAGALAAWLAGCQYISGVNDLEVEEGSGGSGGSGATGGTNDDGGSGGSAGADGGTSGNGGSTGGTGGNGGSGGAGGSGGSAGTGGGSSTGGTGGGNTCTDDPNWECDIFDNCGCSETENCGYDIDANGSVCFDLGSQDPYTSCDSTEDCPRAYGCIDGVCQKHCSEAEECDWDNSDCLDSYDDDEVIEGLGFCTAECDLRNPTAAADGQACDDGATCFPYVDEDGNLSHTLCVATDGTGEQGTPCLGSDGEADQAVCAPGFFCSTTNYTCQAWCDVVEGDCAGGTCIGFNPPAVLGDNEYGTCFTCESGDFECSVYPECGCDTGEACKILDFATGASSCVVEGAVEAWGQCAVQEDCAAFAGACVSGYCRPYCQAPGSDTCELGDCFQAYDGSENLLPGLYFCNAPCEPVLAATDPSAERIACGPGDTCIPALENPTDINSGSYCAASEGVAEGGACENDASCANGYGCIDEICKPWCRSDDDCSVTYPYCYPLTNPPAYVAPDDDVGLCVQNL